MSVKVYKFWSGVNKECILLLRDLPGLAILFVMPLLLILVVTLAQETALKNQSPATEILFLDRAHTTLSAGIASDLRTSGLFTLDTLYKDNPLDSTVIFSLTGSGKVPFGVIIGPSDTLVRVVSDPALNSSYQKPIAASLRFLIRGAAMKTGLTEVMGKFRSGSDSAAQAAIAEALARQADALESEMNRQFRQLSGKPGLPWIRLDREMIKVQGEKRKTVTQVPEAEKIIHETLRVIEESAVPETSYIKPTPIQNNVPGFILFAMFFIVIPLSGSLITEKNEGAFTRLKTLPVSWFITLSSKVLVFLGVCLIQFLLMLLMGTWVFPSFFGLPALAVGHNYLAIAVVTIAAALAAIGFGILVGSLASTFAQAALFGSVMVVVLGLLSGTFLPIHVMPEAIRMISWLSPVRWGIDSYLLIFIRGGGLLQTLPYILLLLLFFGLAMTISISIFARRKQGS
jgi:ABC-2 type transport system permease protein